MKTIMPKLLLTTLLASCASSSTPEAYRKTTEPAPSDKVLLEAEAFQKLREFAQTSLEEEFFVYSVPSGQTYKLGQQNTSAKVGVDLTKTVLTILKDLQQQAYLGELAAENRYLLVHNHPHKSTDRCKEFKVLNQSPQRSQKSQQLEKILCSELGGGFLTLPSANWYDPLDQTKDADIETILTFHALWKEIPSLSVTFTHRVLGEAGYLDLQVNGPIDDIDVYILAAKYRGWFAKVRDNFTEEQGKTKEAAKLYFDQKAQELSEKTAHRLSLTFNWYD